MAVAVVVVRAAMRERASERSHAAAARIEGEWRTCCKDLGAQEVQQQRKVRGVAREYERELLQHLLHVGPVQQRRQRAEDRAVRLDQQLAPGRLVDSAVHSARLSMRAATVVVVVAVAAAARTSRSLPISDSSSMERRRRPLGDGGASRALGAGDWTDERRRRDGTGWRGERERESVWRSGARHGRVTESESAQQQRRREDAMERGRVRE